MIGGSKFRRIPHRTTQTHTQLFFHVSTVSTVCAHTLTHISPPRFWIFLSEHVWVKRTVQNFLSAVRRQRVDRAGSWTWMNDSFWLCCSRKKKTQRGGTQRFGTTLSSPLLSSPLLSYCSCKSVSVAYISLRGVFLNETTRKISEVWFIPCHVFPPPEKNKTSQFPLCTTARWPASFLSLLVVLKQVARWKKSLGNRYPNKDKLIKISLCHENTSSFSM